jgi:hypothetical protein
MSRTKRAPVPPRREADSRRPIKRVADVSPPNNIGADAPDKERIMKHIKVLGLCLLGALAAMALMGAGTASATKLCSENKSPCPAGSTVKTGAAIKGQLVAGTKAVFVTSFLTVECTESTIDGKTTSEGGAGVSVKGEITAVAWKNCKSNGGGACTTSALSLPWLTEVTGSGGSGTMTVSNAVGKFTCGITCEYEAKTAAVSATGGNPALIKANKVSFSKKGGSFFCPATATWSSEYEITTPKPLFVVSE